MYEKARETQNKSPFYLLNPGKSVTLRPEIDCNAPTSMIKRLAICLVIALSGSGLYAQETFRGNASYYSDKLHGRKMSNGQPYNRDSMTCAHRRLPFGTILKVRNTRNGKEVVVKVTDRGPFSKKFILDLSKAAARELDFIRAGFTMVEITKLPYGVPYKLPDDDKPAPPLLDFDEPPAYFFENNDEEKRDSTDTDSPAKRSN